MKDPSIFFGMCATAVPLIAWLIACSALVVVGHARTPVTTQVTTQVTTPVDTPTQWQWTAVYKEDEALRYLQFARASFCESHALTSWTCGDMCDAITDIVRGTVSIIGPGNSSGVRAYAARLERANMVKPRRCVLNFRGSANSQNWHTDAKVWQTEWPPEDRAYRLPHGTARNESWCPLCKVHSGFAQAYEELRDQILFTLEKLGCQEVDVAGHSLGAAVATVAAMDLRGWPVGGMRAGVLWTFGSPRVGNVAFAENFVRIAAEMRLAVPSWRVVHYRDPVPHGGPTAAGYTHLPFEVYYTNRISTAYDVCEFQEGIFENSSCGMGTLGIGEVGEGLLAGDHVKYMNTTFALVKMNPRCHPVNICRTNGYVSEGFSKVSLVFVACASFLLGVIYVKYFPCLRPKQASLVGPSGCELAGAS